MHFFPLYNMEKLYITLGALLCCDSIRYGKIGLKQTLSCTENLSSLKRERRTISEHFITVSEFFLIFKRSQTVKKCRKRS